MDLRRFLDTIYLGDRACKSIIFDGWNETVRIHADCIRAFARHRDDGSTTRTKTSPTDISSSRA